MVDPTIATEIRFLWENTNLSASQIAIKFNITKNAVINTTRPCRRRKLFQQEPIKLFARMDALHAIMDQVLVDTKHRSSFNIVKNEEKR